MFENGSPSPDNVRSELQRILGSPDFVASDRLTRFLRYVVEEALEGRTDRIKERTVALNALGRGEDYDSRTDPVVRIVAGKVRRALDHYYASEGLQDSVRIGIPKGQYWPVFSVAIPQVQQDSSENLPETFGNDAVNEERKKSSELSRGHVRYGFTVTVVAIVFGIWIIKGLFEGSSPDEQTVAEEVVSVQQAAALPYRFDQNGQLEILVVRTLRDSHWTIPKAPQTAGMSPPVTAEVEAHKEAGVRGSAGPEPIGEYAYDRKGNSYQVSIYPVLVDAEVESWPEDGRARRWCTREEASELVASGDLARVIDRFVANATER